MTLAFWLSQETYPAQQLMLYLVSLNWNYDFLGLLKFIQAFFKPKHHWNQVALGYSRTNGNLEI